MDGPDTAELDMHETIELSESAELFLNPNEKESDVLEASKDQAEPEKEHAPQTIEDQIREQVGYRGGETWVEVYRGENEYVYDNGRNEIVHPQTGESLTQKEMESGDPERIALMQEIMQRLERGDEGFIKLPDYQEEKGDETTLYVTHVIFDKEGGVSYMIMSTTFNSREEETYTPEGEENQEADVLFRWGEEDPQEREIETSEQMVGTLTATAEKQAWNEQSGSLEETLADPISLTSEIVHPMDIPVREKAEIREAEYTENLSQARTFEHSAPSAPTSREVHERASELIDKLRTEVSPTNTHESTNDTEWLEEFLKVDPLPALDIKNETPAAAKEDDTSVPFDLGEPSDSDIPDILEVETSAVLYEISEDKTIGFDEKQTQPVSAAEQPFGLNLETKSPFIAFKERDGRIHLVEQRDSAAPDKKAGPDTRVETKTSDELVTTERESEDIRIESLDVKPPTHIEEAREGEHGDRNAEIAIHQDALEAAQGSLSAAEREHLDAARAHEIFLRSINMQANERHIVMPRSEETSKPLASKLPLDPDDKQLSSARRSLSRDGITMTLYR